MDTENKNEWRMKVAEAVENYDILVKTVPADVGYRELGDNRFRVCLQIRDVQYAGVMDRLRFRQGLWKQPNPGDPLLLIVDVNGEGQLCSAVRWAVEATISRNETLEVKINPAATPLLWAAVKEAFVGSRGD